MPVLPASSGAESPDALGEIRPALDDPETLYQAMRTNGEALLRWTQCRGYALNESDETILRCIAEAMRQSSCDPHRAAQLLDVVCDWKTSPAFEWHLTVAKRNIAQVHYLRTARWVLQTGLRFPAKVGDEIQYLANGRHPVKATVRTVTKLTASALVRTDVGYEGIIGAEDVVRNLTTNQQIRKVGAKS